MLVNKQQMANNARMRLYDELLPELERALDDRSGAAEERIPELLEKVRRAGAIAGRMEQRNTHKLWKLWREHQAETDAENKAWEEKMRTLGPPMAVNADPDPPPGYKPPPSPAQLRLKKMHDEIRAFSDKLGAKLG